VAYCRNYLSFLSVLETVKFRIAIVANKMVIHSIYVDHWINIDSMCNYYNRLTCVISVPGLWKLSFLYQFASVCRVKRVHLHAGWIGYDGVFVIVSDAVRSMFLKVLSPISGRLMRLESEQEPVTSMSR